jgi:hypothetical protein
VTALLRMGCSRAATQQSPAATKGKAGTEDCGNGWLKRSERSHTCPKNSAPLGSVFRPVAVHVVRPCPICHVRS